MKIRVTAENENFKDYDICFPYNIDSNEKLRITWCWFVDENYNKGILEGRLEFSVSGDEQNILKYYYEITDKNNKEILYAGYVDKKQVGKGGMNSYIQNISLNGKETLNGTIYLVNKDNSLINEKVFEVCDLPEENNAPILAKNSEEKYGMTFSGNKELCKIYLYKFSKDKNVYERINDINGNPLWWSTIGYAHGLDFRKNNKINFGYPGIYKISQFDRVTESPLSNEVVLNTEKLYVIANRNNITINNCFVGATINLYNSENNQCVKKIVASSDIVDLQNINKGTYYVTQSYNDLESEKSNIISIKANASSSEYINNVNLIDKDLIEVEKNSEFTTTSGAIVVHKLDHNGNIISENLVNTTESAISFTDSKIFKVKLTKDLLEDEMYEVFTKDTGAYKFIGKVKDNIAPYVVRLTSFNEKQLTLNFDEKLDYLSASNPENYEIDKGIGKVLKAHYNDITNIVQLEFAQCEGKEEYFITINGVKDLAGNKTSNLKCRFVSISTH